MPIIPGIMPITNAGQIRGSRHVRLGHPRRSCRRELELRADDPAAATDFGVAYATLQCADLLANGAPGIHFYTLNRSPATRAILSALRTLSPWEASAGLLDVQRVSDARPPVDLPGDVDLVVLAVGADAPGAEEPAPEAEACPPWSSGRSNTRTPPRTS